MKKIKKAASMQVLVCYGLKASAENGKASFLFSNDGSHISSNLHNQLGVSYVRCGDNLLASGTL
ncbi:MAG: hypothetical protein SOX17_07410 [Prevotella sp.]|nr:hypothetical protein [Prevotella sp.]